MQLHCSPSGAFLFLELNDPNFDHFTKPIVFSKRHAGVLKKMPSANCIWAPQEFYNLNELNLHTRSLSFFSLETKTLNKNEEKIRALFENFKQESKETCMQLPPSTGSVIPENLTTFSEKKTSSIPTRLKTQLTGFFKENFTKDPTDNPPSSSHAVKSSFKTKVFNKHETFAKSLKFSFKKKKNKSDQVEIDSDLKSKKPAVELDTSSVACLFISPQDDLQKPVSRTHSLDSATSLSDSDSAEEINEETIEFQSAQDEVKTEILSFLNELNFQIGKDEAKLKTLKTFFNCMSVEDQNHLDKRASIESLEKTLIHEKMIRDKINQTGVRILHQIKKEGAKELELAKGVIDSSLEEGKQTIKQFQNLAEQLLSKAPERVRQQLRIELINVCEECEINLNQARARQQNADLWGLLGTWKLKENNRKLITTKKVETGKVKRIIPKATEMTNKVISPARYNTAEILPNFIKRLHEHLFIKGSLKYFIDSGQLDIPGLASFSEDEQIKNLEFFRKKSLGNENEAQNLHTTYITLWENYRSRGSNPNAYMIVAKKFRDLLDQMEYR